jgi:kinetochore protein Mis13/DSN1
MKQLLTWCGSRALPEKPSGDVKNANAIMAARAIQQELIDDFASKPELSDWFSRVGQHGIQTYEQVLTVVQEETTPPLVVKKPNPQNEKNKATLQELEEEVRRCVVYFVLNLSCANLSIRLEEEKAAWEALAASSTTMPPPPASLKPGSLPTLSEIDTSLLDPEQAAILSALQLPQQQPTPPDTQNAERRPPSSAFTFTTPTALQAHLAKLSQSLEPNIDLFADGVHKIEQYRSTAERVADRILSTASKRLDERDREVKARVGAEGIGVGDILRGLAGVLGEQ